MKLIYLYTTTDKSKEILITTETDKKICLLHRAIYVLHLEEICTINSNVLLDNYLTLTRLIKNNKFRVINSIRLLAANNSERIEVDLKEDQITICSKEIDKDKKFIEDYLIIYLKSSKKLGNTNNLILRIKDIEFNNGRYDNYNVKKVIFDDNNRDDLVEYFIKNKSILNKILEIKPIIWMRILYNHYYNKYHKF